MTLPKGALGRVSSPRRISPRFNARHARSSQAQPGTRAEGATRALLAEAARFRQFQWQAWDMIAGQLEAELGGSPEALDLIGLNHYHTAQWEFGTGKTLNWLRPDPRRRPFDAYYWRLGGATIDRSSSPRRAMSTTTADVGFERLRVRCSTHLPAACPSRAYVFTPSSVAPIGTMTNTGIEAGCGMQRPWAYPRRRSED